MLELLQMMSRAWLVARESRSIYVGESALHFLFLTKTLACGTHKRINKSSNNRTGENGSSDHRITCSNTI